MREWLRVVATGQSHHPFQSCSPYSRISADARLSADSFTGKNEYSLKFFNLSFEGEGEADA